MQLHLILHLKLFEIIISRIGRLLSPWTPSRCNTRCATQPTNTIDLGKQSSKIEGPRCLVAFELFGFELFSFTVCMRSFIH